MATIHSYERPHDAPPVGGGQARSAISILAILAAVGSFLLSAKGREFLAMGAAGFAVVAGLMGGVKALSPRVSGGMLSIAAVLLGAVGVLVAFVALFV
jgi:hypothetical protein